MQDEYGNRNAKMSQAALGRALGLSSVTITNLKKKGMPVHSVAAAQAWREANQLVSRRPPKPPLNFEEEQARIRARLEAPDAWIPDGGTDEATEEGRNEARRRREVAEANMAELAEAKLRKELIRVSSVQTQLATDYSTTREAFLQLSSRLAPLLAAESDVTTVKTLLDKEIHQALVALSGTAAKLPLIEGAFS